MQPNGLVEDTGGHRILTPQYSLMECTLDYDSCLGSTDYALFVTTDRNDHSTKLMAYNNSEQVYKPRLEPVTNGY